MDIKIVEDALKRIEALATNPHWTSDRKWRIAELAAAALKELKKS